MSWYRPSDVGLSVRERLAALGHGARLFLRLLALVAPTFKRFGLVRDQLHFLGNYSLAIIAVSGLFVGFVFGLQGYYTLQRYGSAEALGLLVTLSLVRELGPVVSALLFAGRAGTSLTAEIGLMKAGEQISVLEMMAVDPVQRILAPRFWAGVTTVGALATGIAAGAATASGGRSTTGLVAIAAATLDAVPASGAASRGAVVVTAADGNTTALGKPSGANAGIGAASLAGGVTGVGVAAALAAPRSGEGVTTTTASGNALLTAAGKLPIVNAVRALNPGGTTTAERMSLSLSTSLNG